MSLEEEKKTEEPDVNDDKAWDFYPNELLKRLKEEKDNYYEIKDSWGYR